MLYGSLILENDYRAESLGGFNLSLSLHSLYRTKSLHKQVYSVLRNAIISGEIPSGQRLIETQLAKELDVSRTPIREAIRQLQQESLVIGDSNRGIYVAQLSTNDAAYLYDCRIALEELSVSTACQQATAEDIKEIEQAVIRAEESRSSPNDLTSQQRLNIDYYFHRRIAESSGNLWLVSLLDQVFDKMAMLRLRTTQHNPNVLEIKQEHRLIYEAIAERQVKQATKAIRDHLIASRKRVISEIEQITSV